MNRVDCLACVSFCFQHVLVLLCGGQSGFLLLQTCVDAPVVLQVSSSSELLATVLLLADEGLFTVVSPHVNLKPLQHVETLSAAFGAAPEHAVIPKSQERSKQTGLSRSVLFDQHQPTTRSDGVTANRFPLVC